VPSFLKYKSFHENFPIQNSTNALSSAEELKKFKELLDLGIITQEEFDAKKKQLLGI
jgi:predicted Zn-dependent peptidase